MVFFTYKKLVICIAVLFCVSFILVGSNINRLVKSPIISRGSSPLIITLDKAASAYQFVSTLKNKNLIQSTRLLLLIIRFQGLSHQLKAGTYEIKPGETAIHLLYRVVSGDVLVKNFTVIEGTSQHKVTQDLMTASYLKYDPDGWKSIQENHPNAEGLVLADTYQYQVGTSSKALLAQAHQHLLRYLNSSWEHRASGLPYKTPYELLVAASIIEKETAISSERQLISGVMVNRLNKRMPLQMDPTVIYGLGLAYKGKLSHNDLLIDSPYNTYRNRGLPPTPIALVGKEAIDAAAHPQLSNYLYFVAKGDGSHEFSETYKQQRYAIAHYLHKDS